MGHSPIQQIEIAVTQLPHGADLELPFYASEEAAGMDLLAAIDIGTPVQLAPGAIAMIATGLTMALPSGYEAQVRPRSGLAAKHGVTILNSPGTIDSDYRGEVKVILINHGSEGFTIKRGERIAQMIIAPIAQTIWKKVDNLSDTKRGSGGFGSTGTQ